MFGIENPDCPVDLQKLTQSIMQHEGMKLFVYDDANGQPIVSGYTVVGNPTIGCGRLLTNMKGISNAECTEMLSSDIQYVIGTAQTQDWWKYFSSNDARSRAALEMCYNLGFKAFSGFHDALGFAATGDWAACGAAFLDSLWARQVKGRAETLAAMIVSGEDQS